MRLPTFLIPCLIFFVLAIFVILPLPFRIRLVKGESMFPTFTGSEAVLVAWGTTDLDVGDIAVFWANGSGIVHRVVSFDSKAVLTKGDDNDFIEVVPWRNILGKVVVHCPSFFFVSCFLASTIASVSGVIYELLEYRRRKIYKDDHHI